MAYNPATYGAGQSPWGIGASESYMNPNLQNTLNPAFQKYQSATGGWGNKLLGQGLNTPFASGKMPTGAGGWGSMFGFSSLDPNDPRIGQFMANLRGNTQNLLQNNVSRMAGAGIRRGGTQVAGGPNLEASLASNANAQLAGQYGQDYGRSVDWTRDAITQANQGAGAGLSAYADYLRGVLSAGQGMYGLQGQNLQNQGQLQLAYDTLGNENYARTVADTNRLRESENQRNQAAWKNQQERNQAGAAQNAANQKQAAIGTLGRQRMAMNRWGIANPYWDQMEQMRLSGQLPQGYGQMAPPQGKTGAAGFGMGW